MKGTMKHNILILVLALFSFSAGQNVTLVPNTPQTVSFKLAPTWYVSYVDGKRTNIRKNANESSGILLQGPVNGELQITLHTSTNGLGIRSHDTTHVVHFHIYRGGGGAPVIHEALHVAKEGTRHDYYFSLPVDTTAYHIGVSEQTPMISPSSLTYKTTVTVELNHSATVTAVQNRIASVSLGQNQDGRYYDILGRATKNNFKASMLYVGKSKKFIGLSR